jgi:hypothetical protein
MMALPQPDDGGRRGGAIEHRTALRILVACWLALFVRAVIVVGLLVLPVALVHRRLWEGLYAGLLAIISAAFLAYLGLVVTLRCPACQKPFLIERTGEQHPLARKGPHLDYWGTTVLDIVRGGGFTCMYCGTRHRVG